MKRALLKKWERMASEERTALRELSSLRSTVDGGRISAIGAQLNHALTRLALSRLERQIVRAAYLEAFGVKPTVALVTRKRGGK